MSRTRRKEPLSSKVDDVGRFGVDKRRSRKKKRRKGKLNLHGYEYKLGWHD